MRMVEIPAHAAMEERMEMRFSDSLSDVERERFVRAMSQKTLNDLDRAIDRYGFASFRQGELDPDPAERHAWAAESAESLKEATRILYGLSVAIGMVRAAAGLPPETPYYERGNV